MGVTFLIGSKSGNRSGKCEVSAALGMVPNAVADDVGVARDDEFRPPLYAGCLDSVTVGLIVMYWLPPSSSSFTSTLLDLNDDDPLRR